MHTYQIFTNISFSGITLVVFLNSISCTQVFRKNVHASFLHPCKTCNAAICPLIFTRHDLKMCMCCYELHKICIKHTLTPLLLWIYWMSEIFQVVPLILAEDTIILAEDSLCCTPGWLQSLSKLAISITCLAIQVEATPSQHAEHALGKHSFANFKCLLSLKPSAKAPDKAFSLPGTAVPEENLSVCTLFKKN